MKLNKIKAIILLFLVTLSAFIFSGVQEVKADMGPKPASYITIKGIEGEYVAGFAATKASGPNFDYERYIEYQIEYIDYNPIMEYKDEEGYKWITLYTKCNGNSEISFTYYCPSSYKIIIYQNDELLVATEVLNMYAYATYYEIDFSDLDNIKIKKTYDYSSEIINFLIRVILTLIIELGLFFLMFLYTKRNLKAVVIVNLITQILLNIILNVANYNSGWLSAVFLLFILEFIVLTIELVAYLILLKDKNKILIVLYPIVANLLSFGISLFLITK